MSGPNFCFLICKLISQGVGKVIWYFFSFFFFFLIWYFHLFQNFPQFVVIPTVKELSVINKAEVDVFLEFSCFSVIQRMLAIWSVSYAFHNPAWTSGSSQIMYYVEA